MDQGIGNLITGLVAGLGIGTVLTALVQYSLNRKEAAQLSWRKDLEARYRVIILLMYAASDFEGNRTTLRINRPDLTSKKLVLEELEAEWTNMILFASSKTLTSLRTFIADPSRKNLLAAALTMRKDLGRGQPVINERKT